MWNLKRIATNEFTYRNEIKTERDSQTLKVHLWVPGGRMGEGILGEFGMNMSTLLYFKQTSYKDLLYIAQGILLNVMW